ncbi:hypothetical protein [Couchioplanes caeruleus]|uniref:Fibronectin type-III domain-containing protein n=2 Tax=Couchioplanes caeruleus TaxID=56438 RepID=A0A1K0FEU9_9ACTN|nr:hypothetical protein [Couchioplanes caeruleus]OJF11264.1 hypothetical protein BG844_27405 [Couchioplanes caeruleus subsp. caeruleus]ROP33158.1 hypothetical protein EDD30_6127 [Couchioplanes caeruleus]
MKHRRRWLLLLAPLLLVGCGGLNGSSATPAESTSTQAPTDSSDDWLVVAQGKATPSPSPTSGVPPYPFPTVSAATGVSSRAASAAQAVPSSTCSVREVHFSRITSLDVVAGTTTATATWTDFSGNNLVEYRLTALSQDLKPGPQRDIGWVRVGSKEACTTLTATIRNLDRKTGYVFSLDAVVTRQSGGGTRAGTIMRTGVIYTK